MSSGVLTVRVIGPYGGSAPGRPMTTFLVNRTTSLDAGSLTSCLTLPEQRVVRRVVITHAHFDHVASLPFLMENVFGNCSEPLELVAPEDVLEPLRDHLFNDALWPDFSRLPSRTVPTIRFVPISEGKRYRADGISFTPVAVNHIVPTYGYVISRNGASIVFSGDTGPTQRLWEFARREKNLRAIFLEVSFHNAMEDIACAALHLTPSMLPGELSKAPPGVPVYLYHMKPPSLAQIEREIRALRDQRLKILRANRRLRF